MSATTSSQSAKLPATRISELAAQMEHFSLNGPKAMAGNKVLNIAHITYKDKPLRLMLDEWLPIIFEPSVYNGTGNEERKNIVFGVSPTIEEGLAIMEDAILQALSETHPNIHALWISSFKAANGDHEASLKANIYVAVNQPCRFFDESNQPTAAPSEFRPLEAQIVLQVRGVYIQNTVAGIMRSASHMQTRPSTAGYFEYISPF